MATISDGGYAGRRHNLVEPLFPPLSSSSSNLSPLAPPFVNPYSSWLPAPQPPSSSQFLTRAMEAADWPSFDYAATFRSDQSADGVVADRHYSQFYPDLPPVGAPGDGFNNPSLGYFGGDFGLWKGPFDEELGKWKGFEPRFSWIDPSSSCNVSFIQKGLSAGNHSSSQVDSHGCRDGKYPRSVTKEVPGLEESIMLLEKPKATNGQDSSSFYSISPATFVAPNSFSKGMSYSVPKSCSDMDPSNSSGSNQSYDIPMADPDSCFSDMLYYPPLTRSTSTQLHSPSDVMNDHSLRNADALDECTVSVSSPIKKNNVKFNQNSFSTGVNFATNADDFSIDKGAQEFADHVKSLSSKKKSAIENSMNLLTKWKSNPKLRVSTMTLDSHGNFSAEPENFLSSSSEAPENLNLLVDSPCWKGASTLQKAFISAAETIVLETKAKFDASNDLNQKNKLLEENLRAPTQLDDTMILEEIKTSTCSEIQKSVNLSDVHQKSDNDKNVAQSDTNGNTNYTFYSKINTNQMNENMEYGESETELPENIASNVNMNDISCSKINTILINEETEFTNSGMKPPEGTASIKSHPAERRASLESGQSSSSSSSKKMLIKQLYSASADLLSADCNNDITLDKHDIKLLWSAYNNIYLVLQDKQAFASSDGCAWMEPNAGVEIDGLTQSTIRNIGKYTHHAEFNNKSDGADIFTSIFRDSAHRKIDVTTNAFEENMARFIPERDESSQTLLYKKLWAEAEAANLKMKYDLQVARMKISETEMCKHQSRGNLAPSTPSSIPSSPHKLNVHDTPLKARDSLLDSSPQPCTKSGMDPCTKPLEPFLAQNSNINSHADLESSVMARFKILKGRKSEHKPSNINQEEIVSVSEGVCSVSKQIANLIVAEDDVNGASAEILPAYLTNLGFSIVNTYAQERPNSWSSLVKPMDLSLGARYMEIHERGMGASENADSHQGILSGTLDQSMSNTETNTEKTSGSWFNDF